MNEKNTFPATHAVSDEKMQSLIEKSLSDRKSMKELINLASTLKMHDFSDELKSLMDDLHPMTEEQKEAHQLASNMRTLFNMMHLEMPLNVAWLVHETMKLYMEKGTSFSLMDAAKLQAKSEELFNR